MPTKVELEQALRDLRQQYTWLKSQHDAFKTRVRDEAQRVAEEQGWCSDGLNETLSNLGLDPITNEVEFEVQVTIRLKAKGNGVSREDLTSAEYIRSSIHGDELAGSFEMDSEWDWDSPPEVTNVSVLSVEEVS